MIPASLNTMMMGGLSYVPPLDLYPSATFAGSLNRRLNSAYTGAALRVRRMDSSFSNLGESDIGFTSDGKVDYSAINAFCLGFTVGGVTKLYNQSIGTGIESLYNATGSQLPLVYDSGSGGLAIVNGFLVMTFFSGTSRHIGTWTGSSGISITPSSNYSGFILHGNSANGVLAPCFSSNGGANSYSTIAPRRTDNLAVITDTTSPNYATFSRGTSTITRELFTAIKTSTTKNIQIDGNDVTEGTGSATYTNQMSTFGLMKDTGVARYSNGHALEFIFYNNSTPNISEINGNIKSYYGLP